ncbi:molybdopterin-dependent oxidoreductase [Malikia sp.]|uniref:molybdopterin-dependent oxidoreductase n=1 Tax=Malikia sp. TaxID=2070706 RepID=UPI00260DA46C|nr:molybdopterin-dependent oxidoreductase [Malikia sp.]MDD2730321.1 molybdopterin-dependent oxidoreductase [Malikia sp.]
MNPVGSNLTRSYPSSGLTACGLLLAGALCGNQVDAQPTTAGNAVKATTTTAAQFTLQIDGAISPPDGGQLIQLDASVLRVLPQYNVTTHTPWHDGAVTFGGPRLEDLLELLKPAGKTLHITALNDYSVDIPLSDLQRYQPVLAWQLNGQAISVRNKGPLFLIYPFDSYPELHNQLYYGRSIWQVRRITIR